MKIEILKKVVLVKMDFILKVMSLLVKFVTLNVKLVLDQLPTVQFVKMKTLIETLIIVVNV